MKTIEELFEQHTEQDARAFAEMSKLLDNIVKQQLVQSQDHDLFVRLDERTKAYHEFQAATSKTLDTLEQKFNDFPENLSKKYVTKKEFNPVRSIVYGAVALICVSFIGALATFVFK